MPKPREKTIQHAVDEACGQSDRRPRLKTAGLQHSCRTDACLFLPKRVEYRKCGMRAREPGENLILPAKSFRYGEHRMMKNRTAYWIPGTNGLVVLSAVCMAGSAAARLAWVWGESDLTRGFIWLQIVLPLAANLLFALMLFSSARDRLYRTAIPVWLGCLFFAVKALTFPSALHMALCLLLYALVAGLYTATVTGRVPTPVPLWFLFGLPLLYHLFVEDREKLGWPLHDWLPEISVLFCMAALLLASLAIRRRPVREGEYVCRFGDRNDGRRLRSLSPIFAVSPYIMKTRNASQNLLEDHVELSAAEEYIREKRAAGLTRFGFLHLILAAYVRTCALYPGLNRFISGQKIYSRGCEIEVAMTIKKEMSTDSPDTVIKVYLDPNDTAEDVYRRFSAKVEQIKAGPEDTSFDALAGVFHLVPGLLLKFLVWILTLMDYFGLLPRFLTKLSPFHGSLYITSMASLGIPPIFHHLYDFGNVPVFCSFGQKRYAYELQKDGSVTRKKYIDCNYVTDERIVDGYYFASALRCLHNLLDAPRQLDEPPAEIVRDVD